MERKPVSKPSSNVKSVGFDPETKTLEVEFSSGGVYTYQNVDAEKYDALMKADSVGSYLNAHIKGKHPHSKASAE